MFGRNSLLIFSLLALDGITANDFKTDHCPWINGCKCKKSTYRLSNNRFSAQCEYAVDPRLDLLPPDKIWTIGSTFYNISLLKHLRRTSILRFVIIQNKFPNESKFLFDWEWFPDTATNITFTNNGIKGFRNGNQTGNDCNVTRFGKYLTFRANDEDYSGIPTCLPESTRTISLEKIPKSIVQTNIKWPPRLKILKLTEGGFGNLSSNLFLNAPATLTTIWISRQNFANGSWPKGLPANTIKTLTISSCKLSYLPKDEMERLGEGKSLTHLAVPYNKLTEIPSYLPPSLKILRASHNEIRYIIGSHWSTMTNLLVLDLSHNHLKAVPLSMPVTLQSIDLKSNDIAYSDPDAFSRLKNLTFLNLGDNKLTALPQGIQPGLQGYLLNRNQISHVRDPSEYNFCTKCTQISLLGNPWQCDLQMLKMMKWFVDHNITIYDPLSKTTEKNLRSVCENTGFTGLSHTSGYSWVSIAIDFMAYFDRPPNDKCSYEIKYLHCVDAGLTILPDRIPPGLEKVFIQDNPQLKHIEDYQFAREYKLNRLNLDSNSLTHIPFGLPESLEGLSLKYNFIGNWNNKDLVAFANLSSLKSLFLEDNNITVLYDWQFEGLNKLEWIGLVGNPLHCDCSMDTFASYFTSLVPINQVKVARPYPTCASPEEVQYREIRRLAGYYRYSECVPRMCTQNKTTLNCSKAEQTDGSNVFFYEKTFEPGRTVKIIENSYFKTLDLTDLGLGSDQIHYRNMSRLQTIILSGNVNTRVPIHGLPPSVQFINLTRNEITSLPSPKEVLQYLPNLRVLDLSYNKIKVIATEVSNLEIIQNVYLKGNPLTCNCRTRPFIQWMHMRRDNLNKHNTWNRRSLQNLTCHIEGQDQAYLLTDVREKDYCPDFPIIGIVCGVIISAIAILICVFLLYFYRQKKRERRINEQILLGFQSLLDKEKGGRDPETGIDIDHDYKFDAFVSYDANDSTDAEFVISLLEELEDKRGYNLCLNERDFIPGIGITDNIVECIGESKHIILVLSRSFASSPWCQYEVQVSLAELHRRRKSRLLISVLLEDISADEDLVSSVRTFLSLVSGIQAPRLPMDSSKECEEFWEKLVKMMPQINQ